ncbi:MAG: hypothetical protein ABSH40_07545 [Bryobacteraceae bacterium]|jgi:hypothetical protein
MKLAQSLLVLLLAVRAIPAADRSLTDFFPAGTKVVFGINVRKVAASPLAQAGLTQAKTQLQAQAAAADWLKIASLAGFDPLRDIDEVLVATNGEGQNPPSLIVVTGRFDVERLAQGANRYLDVPVLGGDNPTDGVVALLSPSTALAGDRPTVLAALDHLGSGAQIDRDLAQRIAAARRRYDIWGLGDRPEGFVPPTPQASGLESIDRFQFGVSVSHGLELGAEVHARSPKDAEQIGAMLAMVQAFIKAKQPTAGSAKFDVHAEDGTFQLTMTIPEADLLKAVQMHTVAPAPAVAAKPAVPTAPAVSRMVFDNDGNTVILTLPGGKK